MDEPIPTTPQPDPSAPPVSPPPVPPVLVKKPVNLLVFVLLGILVLAIAGGGYYLANKTTKPPAGVCTMEAKLCPDGTSVGRTGPNCEFAPCPASIPSPTSNPAANWNTYTDSKNLYTFSYPNNYNILSKSPNVEIGFALVKTDQPFPYLTISDKFTVDLNNLKRCKDIRVATNSGSWEYCLDSGSGWGQTNDIADITINNTAAKSFYITGGVDNAYHVVQMAQSPYLELKMFVAGGGLDRTFSQILSTFKFISATSTTLPQITNRNQTNYDYSSWSTYKDTRGYSFKYPNDWFIAEGLGLAQQVQNWDPAKVTSSGALSGNQSKWDINFSKNTFQDINEVLTTESGKNKTDVIEKSKTISGLDIYFIQGTGSLFGNENVRVPIVEAIVVNNNQYFQWNGIYYGGTNNLEILKRIAESISIN